MDKKQVDAIRSRFGWDGKDLGKALEIVMETQKVGISFMKRQFKLRYGMDISYNKANSLIQRLQFIGAVSPAEPHPGYRPVVQWKMPD